MLEVVEMKRQVKSYPFSITEIAALAVINPIGGMVIGWGVNLSCEWAGMPIGKDRSLIGFSSTLFITVGTIFILLPWVFFVVVKRQSRAPD